MQKFTPCSTAINLMDAKKPVFLVGSVLYMDITLGNAELLRDVLELGVNIYAAAPMQFFIDEGLPEIVVKAMFDKGLGHLVGFLLGPDFIDPDDFMYEMERSFLLEADVEPTSSYSAFKVVV